MIYYRRSSPGLQAEGRVSPGAGADVPSPRRESKEQQKQTRI